MHLAGGYIVAESCLISAVPSGVGVQDPPSPRPSFPGGGRGAGAQLPPRVAVLPAPAVRIPQSMSAGPHQTPLRSPGSKLATGSPSNFPLVYPPAPST